MNLLILNHYASIPDLSGAETRHYEIAKRLVNKGHKVTILVGDYHHLIGRKWTDMKDDKFYIDGVEFIVVKTSHYKKNDLKRLKNMIDYYLNGKKMIKDMKKRDVIVASSPHPFALLLGKFASELWGSRFFIELRDIWPDDLIVSGSLSKYNPLTFLFNRIAKATYVKADGIIYLTPDVQEHLKRFNIEKRFWIIPNGIDVDEFFKEYTDCEEEARKIFSKFEKPVIGYFGSFSPSNGIVEFLLTLANVPENIRDRYTFVFFGKGPEEEKMRQMILEKELKGVKIFSPVPKRCVYSFMKRTRALLFTLSNFHYKRYPAYSSNKLVEYMLVGKPIISVYHEGFPHYGKEGSLFFKNPEELSKALDRLSSMRENYDYGVRIERDINHIADEFEKVVISG